MEGSVTNMTGILVSCKQDRHGPCYTLAASRVTTFIQLFFISQNNYRWFCPCIIIFFMFSMTTMILLFLTKLDFQDHMKQVEQHPFEVGCYCGISSGKSLAVVATCSSCCYSREGTHSVLIYT